LCVIKNNRRKKKWKKKVSLLECDVKEVHVKKFARVRMYDRCKPHLLVHEYRGDRKGSAAHKERLESAHRERGLGGKTTSSPARRQEVGRVPHLTVTLLFFKLMAFKLVR